MNGEDCKNKQGKQEKQNTPAPAHHVGRLVELCVCLEKQS